MKYLYLAIISLCLSTTFYSCDLLHKNDDITGLWNFDDGGGDDNTLEQEGYLNLRTDKTFTFYQPYYFDYGRWTFDGHKIVLTSERKHVLYKKTWELIVTDKDKDVLKISFPFADEKDNMPEPIKTERRERIAYKVRKNLFLRRNELQFDADNDPFSIENSKWRMPADHEESCKEIKERLCGNLHHLSMLFYKYTQANTRSISWQHSPHPFVMGSNGIAMLQYGQEPVALSNIFYNYDNWGQAHDMMATLFKEDIDIPLHYTRYADMWYPMLRQMDSICKIKDMCAGYDRPAEKLVR